MRYILASGSPRRREILSEQGITFTVVKPDIEEVRRADEAPLDYIARLSREKAQAVAARIGASVGETTLIISADTTVIPEVDAFDILEKPLDAADARAMLARLRGRDHLVATALTVLKIDAGIEHSALITRVTTATVTMRDYTDAHIDAYIATREPFDKAGGYAIQDTTGFNPVAHYTGSYTAIMGLPVETFSAMLDEIAVIDS